MTRRQQDRMEAAMRRGEQEARAANPKYRLDAKHCDGCQGTRGVQWWRASMADGDHIDVRMCGACFERLQRRMDLGQAYCESLEACTCGWPGPDGEECPLHGA